jgi:tetratricopeptide (TPR) repeat protein
MSPNPFARGARWAAVAGLFSVAAVDMIHTTLTGGASPSVRAAELAYRINPYDSRALTMQATALASEGRGNEALHWLRRALDLNDRNVPALRMTGMLLMNGGAIDEAWEHYKLVEARVAPDLGTIVNIGLLARDRGDLDEAEERLRRAWSQDPNNRQTVLSLAEVLLQKGNIEEALDGFGHYLEMTPPEVASDPRERRSYLAAAMRLGEAYVALGRIDDGLATGQEVMNLGIHFQEWDFASKASSLIATLLEEANRVNESLLYHQQAVMIASNSPVPSDVARQWLNLAHFLERRGWDDRWTYLAFSSAARRLDQPGLVAQRTSARRGAERLEQRLGRETVAELDRDADALRLSLLEWAPMAEGNASAVTAMAVDLDNHSPAADASPPTSGEVATTHATQASALAAP